MDFSAPGMGSQTIVTVLSVSPIDEDHASLQAIFQRSEWSTYTDSIWALRRSVSVRSALTALKSTTFPLVVAERNLPPVSWKELLAAAASLPLPPLVIVTSRIADEYLWAEALNLGAHDVLAKPFDPEEVIRVFSLGWLRWTRDRERQRSRRKLFQAAAV